MIQSPIERQNVIINRCVYLVRELVGVKTGRNNKSCKLKQIQVISVRSAGVPFKVIQSLGTSRYSGSAQQYIFLCFLSKIAIWRLSKVTLTFWFQSTLHANH